MSNSIKETLQAILDEASEKIEQSDALDKLNDVRVKFPWVKKGTAYFCAEKYEGCSSGRSSESRTDGE
mgnify:CR=1 FL=1